MTKAEKEARKRSRAFSALAQARWAADTRRDQPRQAGKLGGRPKRVIACPECGEKLGAREMRVHRHATGRLLARS